MLRERRRRRWRGRSGRGRGVARRSGPARKTACEPEQYTRAPRRVPPRRLVPPRRSDGRGSVSRPVRGVTNPMGIDCCVAPYQCRGPGSTEGPLCPVVRPPTIRATGDDPPEGGAPTGPSREDDGPTGSRACELLDDQATARRLPSLKRSQNPAWSLQPAGEAPRAIRSSCINRISPPSDQRSYTGSAP